MRTPDRKTGRGSGNDAGKRDRLAATATSCATEARPPVAVYSKVCGCGSKARQGFSSPRVANSLLRISLRPHPDRPNGVLAIAHLTPLDARRLNKWRDSFPPTSRRQVPAMRTNILVTSALCAYQLARLPWSTPRSRRGSRSLMGRRSMDGKKGALGGRCKLAVLRGLSTASCS